MHTPNVCFSLLLALLLIAPSTSMQGAQESPFLKPDRVVAADGTGDFKTIQAAVASVAKENNQRLIILVRKGVYHEKVRVDASFVTLRGESRNGTRIEFAQLNEDFSKKPDDLGRAVLNVNGDDFVLENLTVANTAGIIGPHSFAVYRTGDRTVILDCDILSEGADTLSLWRRNGGRYYHARCTIRGAVDFVCPRGWCFLRDCNFYETKATAAVWHDGRNGKDMKFVLRDCSFDGVQDWNLARHHHDGQFYFLGCKFSKSMRDLAPFRVIYPLNGAPATDADRARNAELDKTNIWGERSYFSNSHREGGDYAWHRDNLGAAPGSPTPEQITPKWTFAGTWDPENRHGPAFLRASQNADGSLEVVFSESVTVKGKPRLVWKSNAGAEYLSGSGGSVLRFTLNQRATGSASGFDFSAGVIFASEAGAELRFVKSELGSAP